MSGKEEKDDEGDIPIGPEIVETINISLDRVQGPFVDLKEDEQWQQSTRVFEAFGMHWLMTVELVDTKDENSPFVQTILWCLSCKIPSEDRRKNLPLKGDWDVPFSSDGQVRAYNGTKGLFCNLIDHDSPADAIKFKAFNLTLSSGRLEVSKKILSTLPDDYGDGWGGYYDETWYGAGQAMVCNFEVNPVKHGNAIELRVQFLNEEPWGMLKQKKRRGGFVYCTEAELISSPRMTSNNKKRKVKAEHSEVDE